MMLSDILHRGSYKVSRLTKNLEGGLLLTRQAVSGLSVKLLLYRM